MEYNNTANSQGILQDIDYLCNTNTASYSLADKDRNVNNWYNRMIVEILDSMDEWDFQGEVATADLVANQGEYTFPTDILKIKRIEIDYNGDGSYVRAHPMDPGSLDKSIGSSADINNVFSTSRPEFDTFDDSTFIYPIPDTNRTDGLKIWYMKEVLPFSAFAGSATFIAGNTAEPVFEDAFHRTLSLGASLDYAQKFGVKGLVRFCKDELYGPALRGKDRVGGLISKMKAFYSTRASDKILRFKSKYFKESYK
jgi:hypothetical protein|tara:strand:- start:656 stop:1417 length:762 start_codon:yes stop_codon:yes gene_type:complete